MAGSVAQRMGTAAHAHQPDSWSFLKAQGDIVDAMADGVSLFDTLDRIARFVEHLSPPALCSILLLDRDGRSLRTGAAPSLPAAYREAADGIQIGPKAGSCGTAAFLKERVIVSDIAVDPLWEDPRDFALSFGLRACSSLPILSVDARVLGTIALYYAEPHRPTDGELAALEPAAKLVRLALVQNQREEELRETHARWNLAAEVAELGTYDVDLATRASTWSPQFKAMLGLAEDAVASKELLRSLVLPEDHERFDMTFRPLPDTLRRDVRVLEMRIQRAETGEERTLVLKGRVLFNSRGVATRAIGTLADVTKQRRREAELAEAKTEAERANRAKSSFLASMSHELRTPLNAIIGFSDTMRQGAFGQIEPPRYRDYVNDIFRSGEHLLSLINDVLDMAKIEAGKIDLRPRRLDVGELADDVLCYVAPQANAGDLTLKAEVPAGLTIVADERALRQILTNLLSNAVKFTRPGGEVTLFAHALPDGGTAIGVRDNGIGMTDKGIRTALEPFGQVAHITTVEGRGTGLGLPITKALIEAHGGTFHIESEPMSGSRVWGDFPSA